MKKYVLLVLMLSVSTISNANKSTDTDGSWTRASNPKHEAHWWAQISGDMVRQIMVNPVFMRNQMLVVERNDSAFNEKLVLDLINQNMMREGSFLDAPDLTYTLDERGDKVTLRFQYGDWRYKRSYVFKLPDAEAHDLWEKKLVPSKKNN